MNKIKDLMTRYDARMQKKLILLNKQLDCEIKAYAKDKIKLNSMREERNKLREENKKLKREFKDYKAREICELSKVGKNQLKKHFDDFIDNRIEYNPLNKKGMSINKIYESYRVWFRDFNADEQAKKRSWLQAYLDEKYGKYFAPGVLSKEKGYRGLKMNPSFADDDECIIDELDE